MSEFSADSKAVRRSSINSTGEKKWPYYQLCNLPLSCSWSEGEKNWKNWRLFEDREVYLLKLGIIFYKFCLGTFFQCEFDITLLRQLGLSIFTSILVFIPLRWFYDLLLQLLLLLQSLVLPPSFLFISSNIPRNLWVCISRPIKIYFVPYNFFPRFELSFYTSFALQHDETHT